MSGEHLRQVKVYIAESSASPFLDIADDPTCPAAFSGFAFSPHSRQRDQLNNCCRRRSGSVRGCVFKVNVFLVNFEVLDPTTFQASRRDAPTTDVLWRSIFVSGSTRTFNDSYVFDIPFNTERSCSPEEVFFFNVQPLKLRTRVSIACAEGTQPRGGIPVAWLPKPSPVR